VSVRGGRETHVGDRVAVDGVGASLEDDDFRFGLFVTT